MEKWTPAALRDATRNGIQELLDAQGNQAGHDAWITQRLSRGRLLIQQNRLLDSDADTEDAYIITVELAPASMRLRDRPMLADNKKREEQDIRRWQRQDRKHGRTDTTYYRDHRKEAQK